MVFLGGNLLQFHSHWTLAALRSRLSGQDYGLPRGGGFELVSCPHYLGEIVIYAGLVIALGRHNLLVWIIFTWVVSHSCHSSCNALSLCHHKVVVDMLLPFRHV